MSSMLADPLLHATHESNDWSSKGSAKEDVEDGLLDHDSSHHHVGNGKHFEDGELPPEWRSIHQGTSSFWAATINTVGLLLGMGMLSVPYALQQGGLLSIGLLILFAFIFCYTGCLLGKCLATDPAIITYQDIGAGAFGLRGRVLVTICLYLEVGSCLVGFTISVGDNLAQLFPNAGVELSWIHLKPTQFLVIVSMLVVLPSVCVRDLSYISFLSFGGVVSSLMVVGAVTWAGLFGGVGFSESIPLIQIMKLPLVAGLFAFCYSGHCIIPSIYTSMKDPREFPKVLFVSFAITTSMYGGLALVGAYMFGDETVSQITLNIPTHLPVATLVLWTTVITPLCKFSLGIAPVATELETFLPFPENSWTHLACGSLIRITFLLIVMTVAIALPFFGYVLALIGSAISMTESIIFPCSLYLKMFWSRVTRFEVQLNVVLVIMGVIFAVLGTISAVAGLIESLRG